MFVKSNPILHSLQKLSISQINSIFKKNIDMDKLRNILFVTLSLMLCASCSGNSTKAELKEIIKDAKSNMNLPMDYALGIKMTDIFLDDDKWLIVYDFEVADEVNDNMWINGFDENSKATIVTSLSSSSFSSLIDKYKVGYGFRYHSQNDKVKEGQIPYNEIVELRKKINAGELYSGGFLELMRQQIESASLPIEMGYGLNWVGGYVNDKSANYEYQYTIDIDESLITSETVDAQKQAMNSSGFKASFQPFINEIISHGYKLNYIFKNQYGKELYTISFSGNDLK